MRPSPVDGADTFREGGPTAFSTANQKVGTARDEK
jgi:hypothetical protein